MRRPAFWRVCVTGTTGGGRRGWRPSAGAALIVAVGVPLALSAGGSGQQGPAITAPRTGSGQSGPLIQLADMAFVLPKSFHVGQSSAAQVTADSGTATLRFTFRSTAPALPSGAQRLAVAGLGTTGSCRPLRLRACTCSSSSMAGRRRSSSRPPACHASSCSDSSNITASRPGRPDNVVASTASRRVHLGGRASAIAPHGSWITATGA